MCESGAAHYLFLKPGARPENCHRTRYGPLLGNKIRPMLNERMACDEPLFLQSQGLFKERP